ncbi:MAG: CinA family protein [bacterium]|nr:CinA family protein [bacterium]
MKEEIIIKKLISNKETIATMESCTAGYLVANLTNVDGSSEVIKVSLVTYSNEYKIKFGVKAQTIEKYSVYSNETSREMAKSVSEFANSTYGIGITGQINRVDPNNPYGKDNEIFVTIYNSKNKEYNDFIIICPNKKRKLCKEYIIDKVYDKLIEIL